jgi:hypothetical protein
VGALWAAIGATYSGLPQALGRLLSTWFGHA